MIKLANANSFCVAPDFMDTPDFMDVGFGNTFDFIT